MTVAPWLALDDLPAVERARLPDDRWTAHAAAATAALLALTGGRWRGVREVVIDLWAPPALAQVDPCRAARWVRLPHRDARELLAVEHRGAALDPAAYRIAPGGYLEALPGTSARMPTVRDPLRITYQHGHDAPPDARAAALTLAVELGRAELDPEASALPGNVTSIARQGVTYTMQAASALLAAGLTGLPTVDLWLASAGAGAARRPPRSWNPDTEAPYTVVNAGGTP